MHAQVREEPTSPRRHTATSRRRTTRRLQLVLERGYGVDLVPVLALFLPLFAPPPLPPPGHPPPPSHPPSCPPSTPNRNDAQSPVSSSPPADPLGTSHTARPAAPPQPRNRSHRLKRVGAPHGRAFLLARDDQRRAVPATTRMTVIVPFFFPSRLVGFLVGWLVGWMGGSSARFQEKKKGGCIAESSEDEPL
ncbi:hypothetical protein DL764_001664 [Monosporascus ibericus]|uniref:Uncharacterized protein n=1 Tax=Monosporascus ibericus TaxID=155417 RepID=A0A4Q4TTD9_9PEZI|nr:hypothetical protein DL764_001664 [Monosporascus ibericus]